MDHKFRIKLFDKWAFVFCTCFDFIRICRSIEELKIAHECWGVHRWAWQAEAKHEKLDKTVVEEAHG